jgi:hypothetical protein
VASTVSGGAAQCLLKQRAALPFTAEDSRFCSV